MRTIFDVGVNIGQAARLFLQHLPKARGHSFEPNPKIFKQLASDLGSSRFAADNFDLEAEAGEQILHEYEGQSVINSIGRTLPSLSGSEGRGPDWA